VECRIRVSSGRPRNGIILQSSTFGYVPSVSELLNRKSDEVGQAGRVGGYL
jgi:hypothetical protein